MNAMILAAGLGTRLGALGAATPKILLDIGGVTLLERHLESLAGLGVRRVVINMHHHAEQVEQVAREYRGPLELICVHEDRLLGTAGGVRNALPYLEPGPFIVVYGDILVQEPVNQMVDVHRRSGASATLAVHPADDATGKGVVELDDIGRVTRFAEKQSGSAGPVWINSGIYVVEGDLINRLDPGLFCDFGQEVFPRAIADDMVLMAFRLGLPVIDIGTPEGLALATALAEASEPRRAGA